MTGNRTRPATASSFAASCESCMWTRGDDRVVERMITAGRAGFALLADLGHHTLHQRPRLLGVVQKNAHNGLDGDVVVVRMPAVEVGHHRDGGIVQLRLARELRLRHVGHADHAAAPGAIEFALRLGGELRAFHHEICAAARNRQAEGAGGALQRVTKTGTDGVRHRYMRHDAFAEEALLAREAAIDELVDDDEVSGRQFRLQAADRRQRQHVGDTGALQCVDVGAIVEVRRRQRVSTSVSWQKHAAYISETSEQQCIRRHAPRRGNLTPYLVLEFLDVIDARAADDADDGLNHGQWTSAQTLRFTAYVRPAMIRKNSTQRQPICLRSTISGLAAQARNVTTSCAIWSTVAFVPSA